MSHLSEGVHVLLSGRRRSGKTTVGLAACESLRFAGAFQVLRVEVPERSSSVDLSQLILDRSASLGLQKTSRQLLRAATPLIESLLKEKGLPVDLSEFGREPNPTTRRKVFEVPLGLASHGRILLFLDELQRVASYEDGEETMKDLVDVFSGQNDVVLLTDGGRENV